MKIRNIPAGITLVAGAITSLICVMRNYDVIYSMEVLLVVLIIFALIGMKTQKIIMNVMHEQKMEEEEAIRMEEWKEAERLRALQQQQEEGEEEEVSEEETENVEKGEQA